MLAQDEKGLLRDYEKKIIEKKVHRKKRDQQKSWPKKKGFDEKL